MKNRESEGDRMRMDGVVKPWRERMIARAERISAYLDDGAIISEVEVVWDALVPLI
jgi:hypothetical protein